jgi:hypothetical protein
MAEQIYNAVLAAMPQGLTVYQGMAPSPTGPAAFPYVVLWGGPGAESGEGLDGRSDGLDLSMRLTYAGLTFVAVLRVASRVREALQDRRLVVAGRVLAPLHVSQLQNIRPDFDITIPTAGLNPYFAVDELRSISTR